jgi:hypothetical protein
LQSGAAVRSSLFIGKRVASFSFRALLKATSPEYAALVAQTAGTATIKISYDATNYSQWAWQKVAYAVVQNGQVNGLVDVTVTINPEYHATNGILTFTSSCAIGGIAQ